MQPVNLSQYFVLGPLLVPFPVCPRQGQVPKALIQVNPLVPSLVQTGVCELWGYRGPFSGRNTLRSLVAGVSDGKSTEFIKCGAASSGFRV